MGDFLRILLDSAAFLWPFARVEPYERGIVIVCGRIWKVVGPGVYVRVPWFMEIHPISIAWDFAHTGRCDITASDGKPVMYDATGKYRVVDPVKAYQEVHNYEGGMSAILSSVLSDKLSDEDAERLAPNRRGRLKTSLTGWVQAEAGEFGLEVSWLRFNSFLYDQQTYRLLTDHTL